MSDMLAVCIIIIVATVISLFVVNYIDKKEKDEVRLEKKKKERERVERTRIQIKQALNKEEDLDYAGALRIWESLGNRSEAKRIRLKMREEGRTKIDQTVVHGDYVDDRDTTYIDDRDTIIKDSVVSKSNIGAGGDDKFARLEKLTEMKEKGLIDDDDYEKMKREIIG